MTQLFSNYRSVGRIRNSPRSSYRFFLRTSSSAGSSVFRHPRQLTTDWSSVPPCKYAPPLFSTLDPAAVGIEWSQCFETFFCYSTPVHITPELQTTIKQISLRFVVERQVFWGDIKTTNIHIWSLTTRCYSISYGSEIKKYCDKILLIWGSCTMIV